MRTFCFRYGISVDQWITEIAGFITFKRPKFLALITEIVHGKISYLYIAHKDRLARFGFDLIDYLAKQNNCEIIIANQEQLSPEKEMIEDLMAIIHTFSCLT
jgi:predicted site-specific integrase-resolvase